VRRLDIAPPTVTVADEAQGAVVRVDRRRFERVIANLFANAENYAGGVTEVLLDASNDEVTVTVNDDGPGIAASEREAVFERFFRGQAAHDRGEVQGTGIGLALAREHVLAFGGTLTVDESPTGGAQFRIVLPRTTEEFE
jgi:signal transduction histidine kinase